MLMSVGLDTQFGCLSQSPHTISYVMAETFNTVMVLSGSEAEVLEARTCGGVQGSRMF